MSILPYQILRQRCEQGLIEPWSERAIFAGMTYGLGPAGYDVRLAEHVDMEKGDFLLASTMERFNMPADLIGQVCDKSTLARRGLAVQNTVIEPGWRGYLTLELTAHRSALHFIAGTPIAQVLFTVLYEPTEFGYEGKYQDQRQGAVDSRWEIK